MVHEWLAVAGADASLNILRLQWVPGKNHHGAQLAAGLGVHFKQTCDGHSGAVQLSAWNDVCEKIASFDSEGTIIVWQRAGARFAKVEVNHRRSGSVATAFAWSPDGQLSCVAYKDGVIAVCSVSGQLWTRLMPGVALTWAPGTRALAASLRDEGRVRLYEPRDGSLIAEVPVVSREEELEIVDIQWFVGCDGVESDAPSLAVCFANGLVQIFENERDEVPVLVETQLKISAARWSPDGRLLAIAGVSVYDGLNLYVNEYSHVNSMVQFYTADGKLVVQQVVTSPDICALAWHRSSMHLAVATPNAVSLYVVRRGKVTGIGASPSYLNVVAPPPGGAAQTRMLDGAAGATQPPPPPQPPQTDAQTDLGANASSTAAFGGDNGGRWRCVALRARRKRAPTAVAGAAAPSATVAPPPTEATSEPPPSTDSDELSHTIVYTPCTPINGGTLTQLVFWQTGTAHVIVKTLPAGVDLIAMEAHGDVCVVATACRTLSDGIEYRLALWNSDGVCVRTKAIEIEPVHMSVNNNLVCVASREVLCLWDYNSSFSSDENPFQTEIQYLLLLTNNNPIVSMDASDKLVVIGRKNGLLHVLHLPALRKETKHKLDATAAFIAINCDSTRAAIIDHRGNLKILTLAPGDTVIQTEFLIDSKDVWDFAWSRTEPLRFAVTEKNRTHTFSDQSHEDCIINAAQIVDFAGDHIVAVQFDRLLADPMRRRSPRCCCSR
jgi:WD40 repeat protein